MEEGQDAVPAGAVGSRTQEALVRARHVWPEEPEDTPAAGRGAPGTVRGMGPSPGGGGRGFAGLQCA